MQATLKRRVIDGTHPALWRDRHVPGAVCVTIAFHRGFFQIGSSGPAHPATPAIMGGWADAGHRDGQHQHRRGFAAGPGRGGLRAVREGGRLAGAGSSLYDPAGRVHRAALWHSGLQIPRAVDDRDDVGHDHLRGLAGCSPGARRSVTTAPRFRPSPTTRWAARSRSTRWWCWG